MAVAPRGIRARFCAREGRNMAFHDLREFIGELEKRGELVRVHVPVDPELEITEIADRVSKGPAAQNKAICSKASKAATCPY